ncbi:hypothetical protein AB0F25_31025 [Streptomyces wedmorensis]|uniref:hypothetical protein n=1 Tax=Streptomyces wedmorensis TaxID=43759 RepID=UPI00341559AD
MNTPSPPRLTLDAARAMQGMLRTEIGPGLTERELDAVEKRFGVEHSGFRHRAWPPRPAETSEALRVARTELESVPRLVPVYGHRYLPGTAGEHGHPVLSVRQTDVILHTKAGPLRPGRGRSGHWSTGPTPTTTRRRPGADREPLADAIVEEARRVLAGPWPPRG